MKPSEKCPISLDWTIDWTMDNSFFGLDFRLNSVLVLPFIEEYECWIGITVGTVMCAAFSMIGWLV